MSPNTKGPHCLDTGLPCDFNHSTCNGKVCVIDYCYRLISSCMFSWQNEQCVAFGPGKDMFDSTRIIAEKQYSLGKVRMVC